MRKHLGDANLPGIRLRYLIAGDRQNGYRVINQEEGGASAEAFVSNSLVETVRLARRLRRGSVFPENLAEILEDLRCDAAGPVRAPAVISKLRRLQQTAARQQLGV